MLKINSIDFCDEFSINGKKIPFPAFYSCVVSNEL